MSEQKLSIIIPTFNKCLYLDIVLFSLATIEIKAEIIIVDDGSNDQTYKVVCQYKDQLDLKYIYQSNRGLSAARNVGIKKARGTYLLFMDDDRLLLDNYINNIMMSDNTIVIGERRELYISGIDRKRDQLKKQICSSSNEIRQISYLERYYRKVSSLYQRKDNVIPWVGCVFSNTLIPAWCFEVIGSFDENFSGWGFEDLEFAYRLWINRGNYSAQFKIDQHMVNYHLYHTHNKNVLYQRETNFEYFFNKYPNKEVELYRCFCDNKINVLQYNELVYNWREKSQ